MLSIVGQALADLGLVGPETGLTYHINITTGDAMSIAAFIDDQRFLHVKASEFVDLGALYRIYSQARSDYPAFVPRPLGHLDRDGWSIMVCEGVHHTTVQRADAIRSWWRGPARMSEQLCGYFEGSRSAGGPAEASGQGTLVRDLLQHFEGGPLSRVASALVADALTLGIESLSGRPQHGDFVLNNLGRAGKRLVVFDWEDYGKVCLPGLDILTLYLSLIEDDAGILNRLIDVGGFPDRKVDMFVRRACTAQGLDLSLFRRLVPFYLLVFLYLKRNYGTRVQDRIRALLLTLIATDDTHARFDTAKHLPGGAGAHVSGNAP